MATIGVIPAAGFATRLQPIQTSKEVYPLDGRPVMDYLLERLAAASPDEIRVVTRPDKLDVAENARRWGATVVWGHPASLAESFATGIGDAAPDDVILMGFPDTIWEPVDGFVRARALLDQGYDVGLALFRPREADLPRYETVVADESGRVRGIDVKPEVPSSRWIWGAAAARARALTGLRGQTQPGHLFDSLCDSGLVGSVQVSDTFVDMGTHEGLDQARQITED